MLPNLFSSLIPPATPKALAVEASSFQRGGRVNTDKIGVLKASSKKGGIDGVFGEGWWAIQDLNL